MSEEVTKQNTLHNRFGDDFIWGLKYRPKHIDELILPDRIKNHLANIVKDKRLPNMLMSGPAGTGKTSTAIVLAGMLDLEYLYINASEQTGIDVLRTNVRQFITNVSWDGTGKVVILDEFDRASPQFQDALKSTLEQFSKSCSFIFISNHKNKIIPPLQSRLQTVEFKFSNAESKELKKEFFKSCIRILKTEKVPYCDKVVAQIVKNIFPDMRKILNELQKLGQQEMLDNMDTVNSIGSDVDAYFKIIKNCKFKDLLKYIAQLPGDPQGFYTQLYDSGLKYIEAETVPDFVVLLGKYSYESAFVVDSRINLTAFSTEVMRNCKVKEDLDG
jgi:DNA polymerase III delta prime subunit